MLQEGRQTFTVVESLVRLVVWRRSREGIIIFAIHINITKWSLCVRVMFVATCFGAVAAHSNEKRKRLPALSSGHADMQQSHPSIVNGGKETFL